MNRALILMVLLFVPSLSQAMSPKSTCQEMYDGLWLSDIGVRVECSIETVYGEKDAYYLDVSIQELYDEVTPIYALFSLTLLLKTLSNWAKYDLRGMVVRNYDVRGVPHKASINVYTVKQCLGNYMDDINSKDEYELFLRNIDDINGYLVCVQNKSAITRQ